MLRTPGILFALAAAAIATGACQPRVVERQYEPDVEGLCRLICQQPLTCGYENQGDDCFGACVAKVNWWVPCNREYEAQMQCVTSLSCEEYDLIVVGELTIEERPCGDIQLEFADCHSENLPDDWDKVGPPSR